MCLYRQAWRVDFGICSGQGGLDTDGEHYRQRGIRSAEKFGDGEAAAEEKAQATATYCSRKD
jgi:hypothetical protein